MRRRFRGSPLRDRPLLVATLVFVLAAMMAGAVITQIELTLGAQRRSQASQIAASHAQGIQRRLERALTATYALAALVRQGQGEIDDFAAVATEMLPFYPGAASLQLAPGGVVRQIVPLVGNEAAIGHDLLADPARTKEAFLAKDTGRLTLAGPFEHGEALSLLILDIDHFKRVNDTYGHLAGDAVLRGVGEQCRQVIRACDLIGRMGGEEFAVLLPSTGLAGAIQLAGRLRLRLRTQRWTTPQVRDLAITASIGAASLTPVIATLDDLYARADQALYAAKTGGRDQVCSLDSLDDPTES